MPPKPDAGLPLIFQMLLPCSLSLFHDNEKAMVGAHYQVDNGVVTKYYLAGATRIAMRKDTILQNMTVEYFLGDHLGSTSLTTDADGAKVATPGHPIPPRRLPTPFPPTPSRDSTPTWTTRPPAA
jgi:hypothetical protein